MMNSRIPTDEIFEYLANSRRRYLLQVLADQERCTINELTTYIAKREVDESREGYIDHQRSIAISLVHNHLPRLADGNIIEYDHSSKEVARTERFDAIKPFLENIDGTVATI